MTLNSGENALPQFGDFAAWVLAHQDTVVVDVPLGMADRDVKVGQDLGAGTPEQVGELQPAGSLTVGLSGNSSPTWARCQAMPVNPCGHSTSSGWRGRARES